MIEAKNQANIKISLANVKTHSKCLKSISTFVSERIICSDDNHSKVSIEIMREKPNEQFINNESNSSNPGVSFVVYRFSRKVMKAEAFVDILNACEIVSENKLFMRIQHYYFSKDSDDIFIFFENTGENLQELFNRNHFSIAKHEAKSTFKSIAKALLAVEQQYAPMGIPGFSSDFILLPINIYIALESSHDQSHARILPFDFLAASRNSLDINDLPNNIILSPEIIHHLNSKEPRSEYTIKKSNVYILGLIYLQLLRGNKVLGQSEREKQASCNPSIQKEGPNDTLLKENLEKLLMEGKKNSFVLVLEQCLLYNVNERINLIDLGSMCKNPLLFMKQKQTQIQLNNSIKQATIQSKQLKSAFSHFLSEMQSVLSESNGDIQAVTLQFNQLRQELESFDTTVIADQDEKSFQLKNTDKSLMDVTAFIHENMVSFEEGEDRIKYINNRFADSNKVGQSGSFYDISANPTAKVRRIRNEQFYNPYGLISTNHKVVDFNSTSVAPLRLLSKESSIIDGDVVGIYAVQAVNEYLVAAGGDDASIKIWNMDDPKKECIQTLIGHSNSIHSLCLLQPSKIIASGSSGENASIKIWNISDGACIKTLKGHTDTISSICMISHDLIASGSFDSTVRIWRWNPGKCERILKQHHFAVLTVCTIDENTIASGSDDCSIVIWDIHKGVMLTDIQGHNSWVQNLIYLPRYNQIASCSGDGTVRIWNLSGQQEHVFKDHDGQVNCMIYLENKDILISCGSDQTLNAYKLSSQKLVQKIENAHRDSILSITNLGGGYLVTSGIDSTVTSWKIAERKKHRKTVAQSSVSGNNNLNL